MNFKVLTAMFNVYADNFRVIHWGAKGKQFDRIHNISQKYYNMISEDVDVLAEMALRVNQEPCIFINTLKTLSDYEERKFFIFEEFQDSDYDSFIRIATTMLQDIVLSLSDILDTDLFKGDSDETRINVGIKSEIEGLISKYDLEARYLCARRFKD